MKKAIVVGATSGIGKGIAQILAENNYKVGITGRRENLLEELKTEDPEKFISKALDVIEFEQSIATLNELVNELGGLDLLIISSGMVKYNADLDFSIEEVTIDTNIKGFTCIAGWGFNYFKTQGYGQLVGISSVAGFRGWRNNPAYNASKSYQMNYLEGLRSLANHINLPIVVMDVRPGYVETAMKGKSFVFWVSSVEKVSKQIFKAIKKKRKIVYVSQRWRIGAYIYKKLPNKLVEKV